MSSTGETTIWHPADVFSPAPNIHKEFAIIILNQPLEVRTSIYTKLWSNAIYKAAADGGANRLHDINKTQPDQDHDLDIVIGDLDSLHPDVRDYWAGRGVEISHDPDQYSTDFGKAFKRVGTEKPNVDIVVLGGLGGRVDQGMATMGHLYMFQSDSGYASGRIFLLSSESITFVLKAGKHRIKIKESFPGIGLGKHIGIIPLKEPSIITTKGLEWDVENWETEFGGQMSTSNHVREDWLEIETTGDVLFTIDLDISSGWVGNRPAVGQSLFV
jgi:thiamine pyrophosphokinase